MKFLESVGSEPMNKRLNFGDDQYHRVDTGIVFWIRHCWEIRKVVSAPTFRPQRRCSIAIATMTSLPYVTGPRQTATSASDGE